MCFLTAGTPLNPLIRSCENYYAAMSSSSDLGATKTASTKTKSNSMNIWKMYMNIILCGSIYTCMY